MNTKTASVITECMISNDWGESHFTIETNGIPHYIDEKSIQGYFAPEGSLYFEINTKDLTDKKLIWADCKKISNEPESSHYVLKSVKLIIGAMAVVGKIMEGKTVSEKTKYISTFINTENETEAIVYPYLDLDWNILKNDNEAHREKQLFERTIRQDLLENGFIQKENGRWILSDN